MVEAFECRLSKSDNKERQVRMKTGNVFELFTGRCFSESLKKSNRGKKLILRLNQIYTIQFLEGLNIF